MGRLLVGCLTVVVGVPLLFIAWRAEWILSPPITCSMADQEACPKVDYDDITWRDEISVRVLRIDFTDWDPTDPRWEDVSHERLRAATWVARAETFLDPTWAVVCNPGQRTRIACDPVGEMDE